MNGVCIDCWWCIKFTPECWMCSLARQTIDPELSAMTCDFWRPYIINPEDNPTLKRYEHEILHDHMPKEN